ncbi:hypothetical protein TIFTF001_054435, partial [Ficus carica]
GRAGGQRGRAAGERRRKRERGSPATGQPGLGPVVGGLEVGRRGREEKREKGEERERRVAGAGAGGGSPLSGVGHRRPSPAVGRSPVTEKTLGGKDNVR